MNINYIVEPGAYAPAKAHNADAGIDLRTPRSIFIKPHSSTVVDTGVHVEIPEGYCGLLVSKSGLNVKRGVTTTGLIDAGYTGSIVVKMYNNSATEQMFSEGDKITQLVILPIPEVTLIPVDRFAETERGDNGFGSTGK